MLSSKLSKITLRTIKNMLRLHHLLIGNIFLTINSFSHAEITLDGNFGQNGTLPGPDYLIGANLGRQVGNNLFHSFQDFNLHSHESATFSASNSINNVISRVTGGNPSNIDGLLRATIPDANLYFFNPYGIMFGPNAELDVQGSFHASTADYLRLGDGGKFDARQPKESLLTTAPVTAFGFLNKPASIDLHNSILVVPSGETLTLIGGDLVMNGDLPSEHISNPLSTEFSLILSAKFGQINLISTASEGEIIFNKDGIILNNNQGGNITTNNTLLMVSDNGAGDIFIRGGHLELKNSELESDSVDQDSGIIDIKVDNLSLQASEISTDTNGKGQGGQIILKITDTLNMSGISRSGTPSLIISASEGLLEHAGKGGPIEIEARKIILTEGARITSLTEGRGNSGPIVIKASDIFSISGKPEGSFRHDQFGKAVTTEISDGNTGISGLFSNSRNTEAKAGDAGTILVQAANLKLTDHAIINASAKNAGGGNIRITTDNLLYLQDSRITTSVKSGSGKGGDISIDFPTFVALDKSQIRAQADKGRGGNITIGSNKLIKSPDSLVTATSRLGIDGEVKIASPEFNLDEFLVVLPGDFIEDVILPMPCNVQDVNELGTFKKKSQHEGMPMAPFSFQ